MLPELSLSGDYWNVYGVVVRRADMVFGALTFNGNHNTADGVLVEQGWDMVRFPKGTYNTIQNSVLRNSLRRPGTDSHCSVISNGKFTHMLNNEIYNCAGDSLQFYDSKEDTVQYSAEGTVLDGNEMYITPVLYADCTNPDPDKSLTPTGACACAENAIDVKTATALPPTAIRPELITRITNNVMYGFRHTHQSCGGSGGPGNALTFNGHPGVDFILAEGNVIADSSSGTSLGGGNNNITIRNNLFYDVYGRDTGYYVFIISGVTDAEIYNNTIIGTGKADYYLRHGASATNIDMRNNLFVSSGQAYGFTHDTDRFGTTVSFGYNGFFNTAAYTNVLSPTTNVAGGSGTDAKLGGQYCYTKNKLTAPRTVCIANVIPQSGSPIINKGDPQTGSRKGIGIDDTIGVSKDLTGKARSDAPDIGAFEAGSSSTTPAPLALVGDIIADGIINTLDYTVLFETYGKRTGQSGFQATADLNSDGSVNVLDYTLLFENYGRRG